MKICVTAEGSGLNSAVDPRFGRCRYYVIVETDTMRCEAVENPNLNAASGAGIQSGQLMASKGVQVVLTGHVGPNAYQVLSAAGIDVRTGVSGTVQTAIKENQLGKYKSAADPNVPSKFGMPGNQSGK